MKSRGFASNGSENHPIRNIDVEFAYLLRGLAAVGVRRSFQPVSAAGSPKGSSQRMAINQS